MADPPGRSHRLPSPSPDWYAPYDPSPVNSATGEPVRTAHRAIRPGTNRLHSPYPFLIDPNSIHADDGTPTPEGSADDVDSVPMDETEDPQATYS